MAFSSTALVLLSAFAVGVSADSWGEAGMSTTVTAYNAVCWYEYLKKFPDTNSDLFNNCSSQADFQQAYILKKGYDPVNTFGKFMEGGMKKIPSAYDSACKKYRMDPKASQTSDESDALNDVNSESSYPFKAWAYCLMSQLRKRHGTKAIEAVKEERTHSLKHWRTTLKERDNEFRARHGVPPIQTVTDLNNAAQEWADKLARQCDSQHSGDDERKWRDEATGENLASGSHADKKEINAYQASDGWYEEIQYYPYPGGFDGKDDKLFDKIGHFTQTVWKDTKYVGYGYAYNENCPPGRHKWYIVGRYYPVGNFNNKYRENVMPIQ